MSAAGRAPHAGPSRSSISSITRASEMFGSSSFWNATFASTVTDAGPVEGPVDHARRQPDGPAAEEPGPAKPAGPLVPLDPGLLVHHSLGGTIGWGGGGSGAAGGGGGRRRRRGASRRRAEPALDLEVVDRRRHAAAGLGEPLAERAERGLERERGLLGRAEPG